MLPSFVCKKVILSISILCGSLFLSDLSEMPNVPGIVVSFPNPENIMQFAVEIAPKDGLYSSAKFMFTVNVPATYPYDPPKVQCDTLVRFAHVFMPH